MIDRSELNRKLTTQYSKEVNAMSKLKMIVNVLLAVTILFCLHPINSPIAGDCGDKGAGTPTITGNNNYPEDWIAEFQL